MLYYKALSYLCTMSEIIKLSELHCHELNPRDITRKKFMELVDSVLVAPWMLKLRRITINKEKTVIGGNQRYKALIEIANMTMAQVKGRLKRQTTFTEKSGAKRDQIVEFWEKWRDNPVAFIQYGEGLDGEDLDEAEQTEFLIKDNVSSGTTNWDMMANMYDEVKLQEWGMDLPVDWTEDEEDEEDEEPEEEGSDTPEGEEPEDDEEVDVSLFAKMLGAKLYDSDNEYDIPNLLLSEQPGYGVDLPFSAWGADSRLKTGIATYHFYVDDYRFEAIWKDPIKVLASGCKTVVEPNLSVYDTTPIAYGLQQIYKKRYIARYFQECGIKVYADLNVAAKFRKFNVMGIPKGYNAFATRGYSDRIEYLKGELAIAQEISGLEKPNMIVYGGGELVKAFCRAHGITYMEQFINNVNHKVMKAKQK